MSDSMIIFTRGNNLPNIEQLRQTLKSKGLELESWADEGFLTLEEIEGFWPGIYKGEEAGFEFFISEVDDEDLDNWDVDKLTLEGRDYCIELAFYDELDIVAAALCAVELCLQCDGITFDDEEELTINKSNCEAWARNLVNEIVVNSLTSSSQ